DVAAGVAGAFGDVEVVGVGLGLDRVVDPADGAPHQVQVALVLELHLGQALAVHTRGADLVGGGTGPAVEGEEYRFEDGRLPTAVGAVDADQPGRQLELDLVLVDAVVAEEQAGQS